MRLAIRSISAAAIAAACLALAACSSGSSGNAAGGQRNAANAAHGKPASGGTVTVKQGNKVICVMTVVSGTGTCEVPARKFGVGTSRISASYAGRGKLSGKSGPRARPSPSPSYATNWRACASKPPYRAIVRDVR